MLQQNVEFFIENNLVTPNQSGFWSGDSCINELFSITHDIFKSPDIGPEVRNVFLDILRTFKNICHVDPI